MFEVMESVSMISYKDASKLAGSDDPAVRKQLAERRDLPKEVLYFLADDDNHDVRRIVAANTATPGKADLLLAKDKEPSIRSNLATKLTRNLTENRQNKSAAKKTGPGSSDKALKIIAKDQDVGIRRMVSGSLKNLESAPHDVIKTLAWDEDHDVATPVLTHSPVLQDDDLVERIEVKPTAEALKAISRRDGVSETVTDAVVSTNNIDAISELLCNTTTQFREQTLDELVDKSRNIELWHSPLASRPKLSPRSTLQLSHFVDPELLQTFKDRDDLDAKHKKSLETVINTRIANKGQPIPEKAAPPTAVMDFLTADLPFKTIQNMQKRNRMNDDILGKALENADFLLVMAALIIFSGLPENVVKIAFREKSARGIVSICWKAGIDFSLALQIQQHMGRLAPSQILTAGKDGGYPMDDPEMNWHLDFFKNWAGHPLG